MSSKKGFPALTLAEQFAQKGAPATQKLCVCVCLCELVEGGAEGGAKNQVNNGVRDFK